MAKRQSIWVTEKYLTSSGKEGQRYKLDEKGNKILRDPSMTPEQVVKLTTKTPQDDAAKAERRKKRAITKLNKIIKQKHSKHPLPIELIRKMQTVFNLQKMKEGSIRSTEFIEDSSNASYHVVLFNTEKDWLLVHGLVRKALTWENQWFFFNPYTEAKIEFVKERDKPGFGDDKVIWPEKAAPLIQTDDRKLA